MQRVQESVLNRWPNDPHRLDKRILSLIILAHASDVLENAFAPLSDEVIIFIAMGANLNCLQDYEVAMKRVRTLLELDFEAEAAKNPDHSSNMLWAVFDTFNK
jgi:Golgi phosphoprotein 3